jgi:Winged helix-turn helix
MAVTLTTDERTELERGASSRTIRAEDAKRAKGIVMSADGTSYSTIEATLWCYRDYVNRWRRRFVAGRLDGLRSAHKGQKAVGADSSAGSAHSGQDAATAAGRQHALEHAEAGACVEDPSQPCADGVDPRPCAAASVRTLHAVGRSRLRTQGHGRDDGGESSEKIAIVNVRPGASNPSAPSPHA